MKVFDVYGFTSDDLDALAKTLQGVLNIEWTLHYSSFIGDYCRSGPLGKGEKFKLQPNYTEYGDWMESKHKQFASLLYVSESERFDEIEQCLLEASIGAVLLRRRKFED